MLEDHSLRLFIFIAVLLLMMTLESLSPKRNRQQSRIGRWRTNLSLVLMNSVVLKLLGPVAAITVASYAHNQQWSLLSLLPVELPLWVSIAITVVILDMAIYVQHVGFHKIPFLWRLHQVHHADRDIDVTTGIRFHPLEAVISMLYKCVIVFLLGPTVAAVIVFEIILNASAMFNHANFHMPQWVDRVLRTLIVTPDSHRVHHSDIQQETDSNYGFFLSIWDRIFSTYTPQPIKNHTGMTIGLTEYQTQHPAQLLWCLSLPFAPSTIRSDDTHQ
jgi:sterol desaturase/sphingolipid hydroxylase (fatty acid hydroxylase superfamily)